MISQVNPLDPDADELPTHVNYESHSDTVTISFLAFTAEPSEPCK